MYGNPRRITVQTFHERRKDCVKRMQYCNVKISRKMVQNWGKIYHQSYHFDNSLLNSGMQLLKHELDVDRNPRLVTALRFRQWIQPGQMGMKNKANGY